MTKSPALKSPSKKSHRKVFRPTLWLAQRGAATLPSEREPSPSKVKEKAPNEGFWLPHDIFKGPGDGLSQAQESPSVDTFSDPQNEADPADYPEPDEVEETLDEDAIETQLVC